MILFAPETRRQNRDGNAGRTLPATAPFGMRRSSPVLDPTTPDARRRVKWALDRCLAGLALVLVSPLLATIAIAIKIDSAGPVLYRQKRYGLGGDVIDVLKFRTMYDDRCDAPEAPIVQARRADPRVTRVGRILRRYDLDELPQLWNVLRGSMSLVGPRPHPLSLAERFAPMIDGYIARYQVRPGMTGWAQVNGWRGETATLEKMARRVEHDLYYIKNWSLRLDLYILARTAVALVRRPDDAY